MRAKISTHTIMALALTMLFATSKVANAETAATTEVAKVESVHKFSSSIYAEYYGEALANDPNSDVLEKEYKKQRGLMIPSVKYTYNKLYVVNLSPEFRYNNGHQIGSYPTHPGRIQIARGIVYIGKKGVLNEKDHGFDLEVGYVRRLFNRSVINSDGNHRLRAILNKNVNDNFNFNIFNDFMYNATRKWSNSSWKFTDNVTPTFNIIFNDKLTLTLIYDTNISYYHRKTAGNNRLDFSVENQNILTYTMNETFSFGPNFKYYYAINKNGVSNYNGNGTATPTTIFAPFISMNVGPKTSITLEASWTLTKYNDEKDGMKLARNFHQYPDLAMYFSHAF